MIYCHQSHTRLTFHNNCFVLSLKKFSCFLFNVFRIVLFCFIRLFVLSLYNCFVSSFVCLILCVIVTRKLLFFIDRWTLNFDKDTNTNTKLQQQIQERQQWKTVWLKPSLFVFVRNHSICWTVICANRALPFFI